MGDGVARRLAFGRIRAGCQPAGASPRRGGARARARWCSCAHLPERPRVRLLVGALVFTGCARWNGRSQAGVRLGAGHGVDRCLVWDRRLVWTAERVTARAVAVSASEFGHDGVGVGLEGGGVESLLPGCEPGETAGQTMWSTASQPLFPLTPSAAIAVELPHVSPELCIPPPGGEFAFSQLPSLPPISSLL